MKGVPTEYETLTLKELVLAILFMRGTLNFKYVKEIIEKKLKLPKDDLRDELPKKQLEIKERMKYNVYLPP